MRRLCPYREAQTFRFSVLEIQVELRRRPRRGDLGNFRRLPRSLQISPNRSRVGQGGDDPHLSAAVRAGINLDLKNPGQQGRKRQPIRLRRGWFGVTCVLGRFRGPRQLGTLHDSRKDQRGHCFVRFMDSAELSSAGSFQPRASGHPGPCFTQAVRWTPPASYPGAQVSTKSRPSCPVHSGERSSAQSLLEERMMEEDDWGGMIGEFDF